MGEEWRTTAPFLHFTDHDEALGTLVTEGRRREFRHFLAFIEPADLKRIPDPQDETTLRDAVQETRDTSQLSKVATAKPDGLSVSYVRNRGEA